ncbi:M23 family peptidase, partial [Subtercola sp. Z020]
MLLSVAIPAPASATSPIAQRVAVSTVPLVVATTTALPRASWPLDAPHTVVRPFEAPATPYAAGHRGIDLDATPGQPVYALAAGTVSFAGTVVDRPLVSVTHSVAPPGVSLLSSLEPVTPSVAQGDAVAAGQQIGVVATSSHCPLPRSCLHLGVRLNGAYVSPLLLLGAVRRAAGAGRRRSRSGAHRGG